MNIKKQFPFFIVIVCLLMAQLACSATSKTPTATPQPADAAASAGAEKATEKPAQAEPTQAEAVKVDPTKAAEPTQAAEPTKAAEPAKTSPQAGAGIACFGSYDFGLSCLQDGKWQNYDEKGGVLASDMVVDLATCPDQRILAATSVGVSIFDGKAWKQIELGDSISSPEGVACDANGGIWVAHYEGVSYYDGQKWTSYSSKDLATGDSANDLVGGVVVSPDGTVWVQTANSVAAYKDQTWTLYQQGQGFDEKMFFSQLTLDPQGNPWVATSNGVAKFDGKAWVKYDNSDISTVESIAVDQSGRAWVGSFSDGLFLLENGAWQSFDRKGGQLSSNHVRSLAIDANGRVWAGTAYGLDVFDGTNWKAFRMDNTAINDNDIRQVVVLAGGPALPAETDNGTGSISGQFADKNGNPLAGTRVDICVEEPGMFFTETPCEDQPLVKTVETDATGKFQVTDLPVGLYVVTAKAGENWAQLTDDIGIGSQRVLVEKGKDNDLGKLSQSE